MHDRRAEAGSGAAAPFAEQGTGRACAVAIAVLALTALALLLTAEARPRATEREVDVVLAAMAVVVLVLASAQSVMRWRMERATPALSAAAVLVLGSATIALADLSALGLSGSVPRVLAAAAFVALGAVVVHAWSTGGRGAPRPAWVWLLAGTVVVVSLPLLHLLGVELPRRLSAAQRHGAEALVFGAAWLAVALCCTVQGRRRDGATFVWLGLFALAMALHEAVVSGAAGLDRSPAEGHAGLLLLGALMAARGVDLDVRAAFARERATRLEADSEVATIRAVLAEARASSTKRVHEARNALTAVGGAVQLLERYHDQLPAETRAELAAALATQLAHLQDLMSADVAGFGSRRLGQDEAV